MKKRVKVALVILATLVVAAIVGLCIYLNTPVPDAKYGITMKVSDVSSTGLKLHMEREDGKYRPYVWGSYKLQKWSPTGWEPIELNQPFSYGQDEMLSVTKKFSHTWDLDWEDTYGRLSTGVYRILKEVGSGTRKQTCYALFLAIDWWEVLVVIAGVVTILSVICILRRNWFGEKLKEFIIIRKKLCLIVLASLLVSGIAGFIVYLKLPAKDPEWGISLRVKESSPTGATYELIRLDEESEWNLVTGVYVEVERQTFWGWKPVDLVYDYIPEGHGALYDVSHDFSGTWDVKWEGYNKKLSTGLYRISKGITDTKNQLQLDYYAPFVVINWWEIIVFVAAVILLGGITYLSLRFGVWNRLGKHRITVLCTLLSMVVIVWLVSTFFAGAISSAWYRYEITVDNVTTGSLEGTIGYAGNGENDARMFLKTSRFYCLEKRTLVGWKKLTEISQFSAITVKEGNSAECSFNWANYYEVLPKGTYRIKQPFELWNKQEGTTDTGEIYIVFEVK